ncbi:hypothetical protein F2Q70_00018420 [Brassica cretica]|uniref:RNase H type-1 domain-containing protein n=1 Tax=Brassica cretica TaxID=69181 RepID=A0A8S9HX70_BRACR|nr:hypothetical protein F2Q70_00018420 [Brassica cretica]
MYTDAAWNPESRCAGLAGSSSSHSAPDTSVASPLMAETLALRSALNSAFHCGINTLLIQSDSQNLINLVNAKGRHLEIASLLNDIYLISSLFADVKFKFIPRLDNSRADYVCQTGSPYNINVWYDDWLSSTEQLRPYGPAPKALKDLKVSDLMLANSTDWDHQKIDTILPFHKQVILQIKPSICMLQRKWNHLVFQKRDFTPEETLLKVTREAREWTISQDQLPKPQSHANRIAHDPTLDPNRTCMYTDAAWNPE